MTRHFRMLQITLDTNFYFLEDAEGEGKKKLTFSIKLRGKVYVFRLVENKLSQNINFEISYSPPSKSSGEHDVL